MIRAKQTSESIELGVLLAVSGGMMDAYSYLCRGKVFANAQTGNMLLFGVSVAEGKFNQALRYFFPILAFTVGIIVAEWVREKVKGIHWRQISVLLEALILITVGFIPFSQNSLANSLTSLACGMQVESFRKIHGKGIMTTMCIGNLRSATQNMCDYVRKKDKNNLFSGILYYSIIGCFIGGAILGNFLIGFCGKRAIWASGALLILSFFLMFHDREKTFS